MMVIGRKDIEKMTITSDSWRTGWLEVPDYMQKFGNSVDLLLNYRCISMARGFFFQSCFVDASHFCSDTKKKF
jgi:hypothetical protein